MRFSEWLLFEMADIRTADTSGVELKPFGDNYLVYDFKHGGHTYSVSFRRVKSHVFNTAVNAFDIEFSGPQGFQLTGTAGGAANFIYGQLLLAVKKLMEVEDVQGVVFSSADDAMDLIYNKFYKQFLSNKYLRVTKYLYLRKDVIRNLMGGMSPEERQEKYKGIIGTNRELIDRQKDIRAEKVKNRQLKMNAKNILNKFVYLKNDLHQNPVFVFGVNPAQISARVLAGGRYFYHNDISLSSLDLTRPVPQTEIVAFLIKFAHSDMVHWPQVSALLPLLKQYNIQIPEENQ